MTNVTKLLALGSYQDAVVYEKELGAIVNCAIEYPMEGLTRPPDLPRYDSQIFQECRMLPYYIAPTFEFIGSHVRQGHKVLVHCMQGTSRSPLVLAGFLSLCSKSNRSVRDYVAELIKLRPEVIERQDKDLEVMEHHVSLIRERSRVNYDYSDSEEKIACIAEESSYDVYGDLKGEERREAKNRLFGVLYSNPAANPAASDNRKYVIDLFGRKKYL